MSDRLQGNVTSHFTARADRYGNACNAHTARIEPLHREGGLFSVELVTTKAVGEEWLTNDFILLHSRRRMMAVFGVEIVQNSKENVSTENGKPEFTVGKNIVLGLGVQLM